MTPKYAVQYEVSDAVRRLGFHLTPAAWKGRPTAEALAAHVEGLNASFLPGGANAHLAGTKVVAARIVRNVAGGAVVARWSAGCRVCGQPRPAGYSVTCGRSACQEADAKAYLKA